MEEISLFFVIEVSVEIAIKNPQRLKVTQVSAFSLKIIFFVLVLQKSTWCNAKWKFCPIDVKIVSPRQSRRWQHIACAKLLLRLES